MALQFIITNAGRAAMVNPAGGTKAVQIASVGVSPTAVVADPAITALPGEVKRITTIAGDAVATDMVHLIVRDESDATYSVRSFALYLADGTLFGIYGQAAVILEKSAGAVFLLAVDLALVNVPAANITFGATNFLNPPATTDRAGVVELATDAEAAALVDALRALTPKNMAAIFSAANILSRLLQVDGAGSGLDADLLDGQQGAYYTDIVGRLGYNPLNATSYTASDVRAKLITVDGAGSGVDADMVDGRHVGTSGDAIPSLAGNNYWAGQQSFDQTLQVNTGGRLGGALGGFEIYNTASANGWFAGIGAYSPENVGGYNFVDLRFITTNVSAGERMRLTGDGRLGIGTTAPGAKLHVVGDAIVSGPLTIAGSTAWHAGNDGAGSGLDADLLDGQQGAYYTDIVGRLGYTPINPNPGANTDQWFFSGRFRFACYGSTGGQNGVFPSSLVITSNGNTDTGAVMTFHRNGAYAVNMGLDNDNLFRIGGSSAPGGLFEMDMAGNLRLAGSKAWTAGNDGAGSGLDADMVDGRDASEFALLSGAAFTGGVSVAGSMGIGTTTPLRKLSVKITGDEFGGVGLHNDSATANDSHGVSLIATNTANTLRNWLNIVGSSLRFYTYDIERMRIGTDGTINALFPLKQNGSQVWHLGNDGAGSGLDADLLDGRQAAEFALLSGATFSGPVGRDANFYLGMYGSLAQLVMGDGAQINFDRQNRIFNISVDNKNPLLISTTAVVVGEGLSLSRANAGRYVHYGDGSIKGDTITRGVGTPAGGTDGDQYLQINTGAGTMTVWHNYGGTWVHT